MKTIVLSLALLTLSACSTNPAITHTSNNPIASSPDDIRAIALHDTQSLQHITPKLATYKAVFVGESHTDYGDHLNQLAVIKSLRPQWPHMAIGIEFVQTPFQKALDDYIAGNSTELEMLRDTQWYDRWGYDFRLYRAIFNYAQQEKIPLIALNTPKEITKRISKVGIAKLTQKERSQLPAHIDKSNKAYRASLEKVYSQHATTSSKKFERFLEAQLAWDETMADSAAKYLHKHPKANLVILAGSGHIEKRHGIPSRLERRIQHKTAVVLNRVNGSPSSANGDYLLFSKEATLPKAGKMGIFMKNVSKGVLISKVSKESASDKAGLKKGDVITALNKDSVKSIQDIKISMMEMKPKEHITLSILRNNKTLSKTLELQ